MKLKFKAEIPKLGVTIENPTIYPDSEMIGFDANIFNELIHGMFIIGEPDNNGNADIMDFDLDENEDEIKIMKILCGYEDWYYLESGYKLFMSIDSEDFKEVEL